MRTRNRIRDCRGQALVELALLLPLVLLILFGIVEMGRAWQAKQTLTDVSREACRRAVVDDPTVTQAKVDSLVQDLMARAGFSSGSAVLTFPDGFHSGKGNTTTCTLTMPYRFVVLHRLVALVTDGNGTITLTMTAKMRNEG